MRGTRLLDREFLRRRRVPTAVVAGLVLLALVETASALLAPLRAPSDADWRAAASRVRAGFRPGDLIVAAPEWADQVMRLHLGDLVPIPVAGRMDAARYGRIWEVSQRGGRSPEVAGATAAETSRHGALTVRRWERRPAAVRFDFLAGWEKARFVRVDGGGAEGPLDRQAGRATCPGGRFAGPELVEAGTTMRNALLAPPVAGATVAVEWREVPLGRELAVGAGLHHVWLRKAGEGTVTLRALVDGREVGRTVASNRSGWSVARFDTAAHDGRTGVVRFEITSAKPHSRCFAFAAEARSP